MCAAIRGIYAVGEAQGRLGEAIVVLNGDLDRGAVDRLGDVDWHRLQYGSLAVEVADEADNTTFKVEGLLLIVAFVSEPNLHPFVQVCHLAE